MKEDEEERSTVSQLENLSCRRGCLVHSLETYTCSFEYLCLPVAALGYQDLPLLVKKQLRIWTMYYFSLASSFSLLGWLSTNIK